MVKQFITSMVDVKGQYLQIKEDIDEAVMATISSSQFINGPVVKAFQEGLQDYLQVKSVIPCANGTDALQIALMALELQPGDEVIVPSFTYASTAEVIALLRLQPIMVDVDPDTFNITLPIVEAAFTPNTKAIIPVHLFGQSTDMEPIVNFAKAKKIAIVEDNAQAIGAQYTFKNGQRQHTGTIGDIGCTSFYPSKNLGCYGDGGALFTNDETLGQRIKMVANHGQQRRYYHDIIGVNSRLDAIQAAILNVKLKHLDKYSAARQKVAKYYDKAFADIEALQTPTRQANSTHVFHQYTLKVLNGRRDELKAYLLEEGVPSMIYYPVPLYKQEAYKAFAPDKELAATEMLCESVLSLPIHTEMTEEMLEQIVTIVRRFFR